MTETDQPPATASTATPPPIRLRLWVMMFLQYFVQGCYLPILSVYAKDALGFNAKQLGAFGAALAVGPLFAPFIIGQLVDRRLATERVLAFCHLAGGITMLALYYQSEFWPVIILGTVYSVLYVPSLMLTNSLAFHHLRNRDLEFPPVRLWGTIGFVLPAWWIELYWLQGLTGEELNVARGIAFWLAGAAGIVMAVYCLTLPSTPPQPRSGERRFAPGLVIEQLRRRDFAALVVVTFFVAMVHKFYFVWNGPFLTSVLRGADIGGAWEQRISSIGQISEVAVMAGLGLSILRLGFKGTMIVGTVAYLARCLVFAMAAEWGAPVALPLACVGQALHGLCFGCFLAAAFMYVDRVSPADIRGSMQNLYGTFVIGLGFFVGGLVSGEVGDWLSTGSNENTVYQWANLWLACGALAAACVVVFAVWFPREDRAAATEAATMLEGGTSD